MLKSVAIYKEKKSERLIILPSGIDEIGLTQYKDYGILSYTTEEEKIGEFILWALSECDEEIVDDSININFQKKYFNRNSYRKVLLDYDLIIFEVYEREYELFLNVKDGLGHGVFKDKEGNRKKHIFSSFPTALELGERVMELFEFKEKYDEENGL